MVKQFLTLKGKEFEVVNLDEHPEKRQELFELTGALTVPITQVDDQFIIGWNRQRLAEVL
jgi:glutaredoxin